MNGKLSYERKWTCNEKFCCSRENDSIYSCSFEYRITLLKFSSDIRALFFFLPAKNKVSKKDILLYLSSFLVSRDRARYQFLDKYFFVIITRRANVAGAINNARGCNYSRGMNFKVGLIKDSIASWWALTRN